MRVNRLSNLHMDFTTSIILPYVEKGKEISFGNFGHVWQGCLNGTTNVALKALSDSQYNSSSFQLEVNILRGLKHQNIVQFYGVTELEGVNYIVMEYMPMGSLFDLLKNKTLTEYQKVSIAISMAEGMNYLSVNNVVHRDLAARNVLVEKKNEQYSAKITDFGLALSDKFQNTSNNLPFRWTAPEVFEGNPCTSASDVWSFGVVLYEMFKGEPHKGRSLTEVRDLILARYKLTLTSPHYIAAIMYQCLEYSPESRPTFLQIFKALTKTLTTLQSKSVYVNSIN